MQEKDKLDPLQLADIKDPFPLIDISSLEQNLKENVAFLRTSPFLAAETKARVSGWIYDIETGLVNPVDT